MMDATIVTDEHHRHRPAQVSTVEGMKNPFTILNRKKYSKLIGAVGAALTATAYALANTDDGAAIGAAVLSWGVVWSVWGPTNEE